MVGDEGVQSTCGCILKRTSNVPWYQVSYFVDFIVFSNALVSMAWAELYIFFGTMFRRLDMSLVNARFVTLHA